MDMYLNKATLAQRCGVSVTRFDPPLPDVVIGRSRGWKPSRVRTGHVTRARGEPVVLLSLNEVARRLNLSPVTVKRLRHTEGFPFPAACIEAARPDGGDRPTAGWAGNVYGWQDADVARYAAHTGRGGGATTGKRGRPTGSGYYQSLPRCGRPLTESVNGKGRACKAVRRKIDGEWAPACGMHLSPQERHTLGLT